MSAKYSVFDKTSNCDILKLTNRILESKIRLNFEMIPESNKMKKRREEFQTPPPATVVV